MHENEQNDQAGQADPLDRLAVVEDQLRQAAEEKEVLRAELDTLKAQVTSYQQAEADRKAAEAQAYLTNLRTASAACQSPIPEDDMKLVSDALERGDRQTAEALGSAFLSRSQALGSGAGLNSAGLTPLAPKGEQVDADRGRKALLAAAGFSSDERPAPRQKKWS